MTNEEQILQTLRENGEMIRKTYESAEKTRKYILYSVIATILLFLIPLIGLVFVIPYFLDTYTKSFGGL